MFVYVFFKLLASYEFASTGLEGETASRASVGGHRRIATLTPNGAKRRILGGFILHSIRTMSLCTVLKACRSPDCSGLPVLASGFGWAAARSSLLTVSQVVPYVPWQVLISRAHLMRIAYLPIDVGDWHEFFVCLSLSNLSRHMQRLHSRDGLAFLKVRAGCWFCHMGRLCWNKQLNLVTEICTDSFTIPWNAGGALHIAASLMAGLVTTTVPCHLNVAHIYVSR